MKKFTASFIIFVSLAVAACTPTVNTRGNLISETKFDLVQPQTSTRADVMQYWGPPTTTSTLDQNTWYYIGERTSQKGIFAPEVEKRRLIRVQFDPQDSNTVTEVAELDPAQGQEIDIVERRTPTAGKEYTALQQFIGNIGKFNTEPPK